AARSSTPSRPTWPRARGTCFYWSRIGTKAHAVSTRGAAIRRSAGCPRLCAPTPTRSSAGSGSRSVFEIARELRLLVRRHAPARLLPLRLVRHPHAHRVGDEALLERPLR